MSILELEASFGLSVCAYWIYIAAYRLRNARYNLPSILAFYLLVVEIEFSNQHEI